MIGPQQRAMRTAEVVRKTRETDIRVLLNLDPALPEREAMSIATGVPFFDHMLHAFARHGRLGLVVEAKGDTHIDDHHTVEDTGLVLGKAMLQALGEKIGIVRFSHAYAPMDEALARAAVDISGRPYMVFDAGPVHLAARVGTFDTELVDEFWRAFATEARIALHLDLLRGANTHHACEALFKAAGLALHTATRIEPGVTTAPSTKGSLA